MFIEANLMLLMHAVHHIMHMKDFTIHNANLIFLQKVYRPESYTDLMVILFYILANFSLVSIYSSKL
jgi:hypothetical protein